MAQEAYQPQGFVSGFLAGCRSLRRQRHADRHDWLRGTEHPRRNDCAIGRAVHDLESAADRHRRKECGYVASSESAGGRADIIHALHDVPPFSCLDRKQFEDYLMPGVFRGSFADLNGYLQLPMERRPVSTSRGRILAALLSAYSGAGVSELFSAAVQDDLDSICGISARERRNTNAHRVCRPRSGSFSMKMPPWRKIILRGWR